MKKSVVKHCDTRLSATLPSRGILDISGAINRRTNQKTSHMDSCAPTLRRVYVMKRAGTAEIFGYGSFVVFSRIFEATFHLAALLRTHPSGNEVLPADPWCEPIGGE